MYNKTKAADEVDFDRETRNKRSYIYITFIKNIAFKYSAL